MDEPNHPLAIYPAPKKKRPPNSGISAATQRALFLLAGAAIGGVIVLATLHFASPKERVVYKGAVTPDHQQTPLASQPDPEKKATEPGNPNAQPAATDKTATDKTAPPGAKTDANMFPFNPFDGSVSATMPPKEITGRISPGSGVSMPPKAGDPAATEDATPTRGLLITMRLDVSDPGSALRTLQGIASKAGGSAIQFDEAAAKLDAEGAIVFVPASKADEMEKQIAGVGGVVVRDRWSGSSADRLDKIEQSAQDHLSDLRIRRQELLVKYFEDAPQVKHIDEDSERINKSIAALRAHKPGPNVAVLKIKFLG